MRLPAKFVRSEATGARAVGRQLSREAHTFFAGFKRVKSVEYRCFDDWQNAFLVIY